MLTDTRTCPGTSSSTARREWTLCWTTVRRTCSLQSPVSRFSTSFEESWRPLSAEHRCCFFFVFFFCFFFCFPEQSFHVATITCFCFLCSGQPGRKQRRHCVFITRDICICASFMREREPARKHRTQAQCTTQQRRTKGRERENNKTQKGVW